MSLADDLEHIAEHIGDDQPNLPEGAKNTLLMAARALRIVEDADQRLRHFKDASPFDLLIDFNLFIDATTAIREAASQSTGSKV